jgi:hypothetical protein
MSRAIGGQENNTERGSQVMKKPGMMVAVMAILGLLLTTYSFGQTGMAGPRMGPRVKGPKKLNVQKMETISGEVVRVVKQAPKKENLPAQVLLRVQTDRDTVEVMMGPAWFLDQQTIKIAEGDKVEVKAARSDRPKGTVFTAVEVKKGDQTLVLRDATGAPLWGPQKKR